MTGDELAELRQHLASARDLALAAGAFSLAAEIDDLAGDVEFLDAIRRAETTP